MTCSIASRPRATTLTRHLTRVPVLNGSSLSRCKATRKRYELQKLDGGEPLSPEGVVAGAIGDRLVLQPQRFRGDDRDRRYGLATTGKDVEDDIGGVNAIA